MKKIILLMAITFAVFVVKAQTATPQTQPTKAKIVTGLTTTVTSYKDSTSGFTYPSLYAAATGVQVNAFNGGYRVGYRVSFYNTASDYDAGKQTVLIKQYSNQSAKYPTEAELKTGFLALFKSK